MDDLLAPFVTQDASGFWELCSQGSVSVQSCDSCSQVRFPATPMCPQCHSSKQSWLPVVGRGTVWSFAVPHPPLLPAYAALAPYVVAVIALDDPKVRFVGNLFEPGRGCELVPVDPGTVEIGEPVEVTFQQRGDLALPQWVRRTAGTS